MAASCIAGSALSASAVAAPASSRCEDCVIGGYADFISFSARPARRRNARVCGRSSVAGSRSSSGAEKSGDGLGLRNGAKERRRVRLFASSSSAPSPTSLTEEEEPGLDHGNDGSGFSGRSRGGGGGGDDGPGGSESGGAAAGGGDGGILGQFIRGWHSRVKADPQFPFKILMEQVVGVGACMLGDMATRPNFGLNELDLVFSTLVVGSILNFSLMYMLAPTAVAGAAAAALPGIFAGCPPGHMFEIGSYSLLERAGTFVYKGAQFAVLGFVAGMGGTGIANGLIKARQKVDPDYVPQSASPPLLLNSVTWAIQMGVSSNARYQSLNWLEFALAKSLSPGLFKVSVPVLRATNNVLGGTSFVLLARLTGSQPKTPPKSPGDQKTDPAFEHAFAS